MCKCGGKSSLENCWKGCFNLRSDRLPIVRSCRRTFFKNIPVQHNLQDRGWAACVGLPLLPPQWQSDQPAARHIIWLRLALLAPVISRISATWQNIELCGVNPVSELNTILFCYVHDCSKVDGISGSLSGGSVSIPDPNVGYPGWRIFPFSSLPPCKSPFLARKSTLSLLQTCYFAALFVEAKQKTRAYAAAL